MLSRTVIIPKVARSSRIPEGDLVKVLGGGRR